MADLFREVDEAMHQERMAKLWTENRVYIIGFVIGTILLTAALSGYRTWDAGVKEKQTATLIALQDAPEYPANILDSEKLDMRAGLRGITLLQAAGAFLDQDKRDEAAALYERAGADAALPDEFRHLGILMAVRLSSHDENADGTALLEKLSPILKADNSPWNAHARLEAAAINARMLQNYENAQTHLKIIADTKDLPDSLYQRARALAHIYKLEQKSPLPHAEETKEKTKEPS
ncbi:MAG: hypothetical protein R3E13_07395 [Alphaproteobacteria bacterium]